MDLVQKFLNRLDKKRRASILAILDKIYASDFDGLDIKKLKSEDNVFRVRKGKIRIIYRANENGHIVLLGLTFRGDNTY